MKKVALIQWQSLLLLDFDSIGLVGYSLGTTYGQVILARIADFKGGVFVNALLNITLNARFPVVWSLGALTAYGAAIPGWPGETITYDAFNGSDGGFISELEATLILGEKKIENPLVKFNIGNCESRSN